MKGIRATLPLSVAVILAGCATNLLEPQPGSLAPFSTSPREAQPEDAFAAVYDSRDVQLVWIGAKHATQTNSKTFEHIRSAYDNFDFDLVIVEGCPTSWGRSPERLITYAKEAADNEQDGFQEGGETVPTVLGALDQGAVLLCGEPDDTEIKERLLGSGFDEKDLLGFYVLRSIPQWIRERRISDAADPAIEELLANELQISKQRLDLEPEIMPAVDDWRAWYRAINGAALSDEFSTEEAGPLIDGPFGSNRVGAAISRARAEYLHDLVIGELKAGQDVLVVFGASHLMIHKPGLDAAIGAACAVGFEADGRTLGDCV